MFVVVGQCPPSMYDSLIVEGFDGINFQRRTADSLIKKSRGMKISGGRTISSPASPHFLIKCGKCLKAMSGCNEATGEESFNLKEFSGPSVVKLHQ